MLIEVVPVNWWKVSIDPGGMVSTIDLARQLLGCSEHPASH